MQLQVRVLTEVAGSRLYSGRWVLAMVRNESRGRSIEGGASLPVGGTDFDVPRGTVGLGAVIRFRGQFFKVTGTEPVPPFWLRDRLTTEQAGGTYPAV